MANLHPLFFDQPNCQGNAFVDSAGGPNSLYALAAIAPDGTIRIAVSHTGSTRIVNSQYDDNVNQTCTNQTLTLSGAVGTQMGPNLRTRFSPPFSISSTATLTAVTANTPVNAGWLLGAIAVTLALVAVLKLENPLS